MRFYKSHEHNLQGTESRCQRDGTFSMEPSTDNLHVEDEMETGETGRLGTAKGNATQTEWLRISEVPALHVEGGPAPETHLIEGDASCSSPTIEGPERDALEMVLSPSSKPPALPLAESSETLPMEPPEGLRPSRLSLAEMDCLICFNRYSLGRLPKLLACRHAFCAVCLKLILRREDRTWLISCPLCRKATVVFGGLICSLHDKEDLVDRLECPGFDAEAPCPMGPPDAGHAACWPVSGSRDPAVGENNRAAAKRLVMLLLLVVMLIALVLPFMYTGLLKWALCFVVGLGLVMSVALCCNPSWRCLDPPWPSWRKKDSHVASVA